MVWNINCRHCLGISFDRFCLPFHLYTAASYCLERRECRCLIILCLTLADQFVAYKRQNGCVYQTGATAFLREFSRYLIARGYPDAYLILAGRTRLPTPVSPYFFTEKEISAFFRECDSVRDDPHHKGRHLVLPAVFRLLHCCGLRYKEARILARKDVYLDKGYFDVLQSKGPKSRRICISKELTEYLGL